MNVNDYVENPEEIEDTPYLANKRLLTDFRDRLDEFERQLNQAMVNFDNSQRSTAAGLQNVYNEFKALVSGTMLTSTENKIQKMKEDLYSLKRDLLDDIKFVRKCYKIMPAMSKIKELDEESFERLQKVLALIS